ncbi:MAG: RNA-directed DNA polymerase [Oscillospiraceae bacterium]|nr:RNA-directed DNA polymerase [Oscillospiraceae bacterium]
MKRYGNIYDKICDFENIKEAHRNARKNKGHYGEVKMVDAGIDGDPDYYLRQAQDLLVNKSYKVSPYTLKTVNDTGKERLLMKLPYYPDRIIQWAVMLQIEHIFMEVFTNFTCASLKFRGIHHASKLLDRYMLDRAGTKYCLKIDIAKFYPNIDHDILKQLLRRKFKDADLLVLLDRIIDSMPDGKGVPIGSYLSQYLANFYLAYFDHWLKEEQGVKYVIRYMDDIVILSDSKIWLHNLKMSIDKYLFENLSLKLKGNWQVFPTNIRGIDFVGYRHFYDYKLLRKSSCKRFKQKMNRIRKKVIKNEPIKYTDFCAVNSYLGWLKWCDSFRLIRKYVEPIKAAIAEFYITNIKGKKGCFA